MISTMLPFVYEVMSNSGDSALFTSRLPLWAVFSLVTVAVMGDLGVKSSPYEGDFNIGCSTN